MSFLIKLALVTLFMCSSFLISSVSVSAQGEGNPPKLDNPLKENFTSLTAFINAILEKIVLPIGAVIAVFFIIFSGFLFVTAQGNEEKLAKAKTAFLWTAIGVLILLGSMVISNGIAETICQIGYVPGLCPKP